jgi:hypothetical protein
MTPTRTLALAALTVLPLASTANASCPGNPNDIPGRCEQITDSRALLNQQWSSIAETIFTVRVYINCHMVEPVTSPVAISNLEMDMQDMQINAGLLDDPTMNVLTVANGAIARADKLTTASADTCKAVYNGLTPAERAAVRNTVNSLAANVRHYGGG